MATAPQSRLKPLYASAIQALYVTRPADRAAARTMLSMWRHFDELEPAEAENVIDIVLGMLEREKALP